MPVQRFRMVRVVLTDEEWQAVRVAAIKQGVSTTRFVSDALRKSIEGKDKS